MWRKSAAKPGLPVHPPGEAWAQPPRTAAGLGAGRWGPRALAQQGQLQPCPRISESGEVGGMGGRDDREPEGVPGTLGRARPVPPPTRLSAAGLAGHLEVSRAHAPRPRPDRRPRTGSCPGSPARRARRLERSGADAEAPRLARAHRRLCTPTAVPARPPPRLDGARAAIGAALRPARLPWRRAFVWPRRGRSAREQRPRPRRREGEGGESRGGEREGGRRRRRRREGRAGRRGSAGKEGRALPARAWRPAATVSPPRRGVGSAGFGPRFAAGSTRPWAGPHPGSAPSHTCPSHLAVRARLSARALTRLGSGLPHPRRGDCCALTSCREPHPPPLRVRGAPADSQRSSGTRPQTSTRAVGAVTGKGVGTFRGARGPGSSCCPWEESPVTGWGQGGEQQLGTHGRQGPSS